MTVGLMNPLAGHPITQPFGITTLVAEPSGYLYTDAHGALKDRGLAFSGAVHHPHVHPAVDVACPIGTPIRAPIKGRIVAQGEYLHTASGAPDGELFTMLQVRPGTILFFTHESKHVAPVGSRVVQGQIIAYSGNSGISTGPHCHWEVRTGSPAANPLGSWDIRYWFRWNPLRCLIGGDLAGASWLVPA